MSWRVAVIGSGQWARVHLAALSNSPLVSGVVLAGRNPASLQRLAAEFAIVQRTTTTLSEVWDDDGVAVVDIVLPHHLHAQTALAALEAGKHVVCEKPGATKIEDLDRAVAAAESHGRRLLIVMNQLYDPVNHQIRRLVDEGALGRVFLVVETGFSRHDQFYRDPHTWRTRREQAGGGVLIDGGYHMIYKHLYWLGGLGRPQWVIADAAQLAVDPQGKTIAEQGEDFVCFTVGYDGPLRIASSHAWTLAADPARAHQNFLAGTEATLDVSGDEQPVLQLRRPGQREVVQPLGAAMTRTQRMEACLLDYVDALYHDRPPQYGSYEISHQTLQIILAVYESARTGQRVELLPRRV